MPDHLVPLVVDAVLFGFLPNTAVAAAAFFRFRTTSAGWLIGTAFAARALIALLLAALPAAAFSVGPPARGWIYAFGALTRILSTGLWLVAAAGVLLIPRALERLGPTSAPPREEGTASSY